MIPSLWPSLFLSKPKTSFETESLNQIPHSENSRLHHRDSNQCGRQRFTFAMQSEKCYQDRYTKHTRQFQMPKFGRTNLCRRAEFRCFRRRKKPTILHHLAVGRMNAAAPINPSCISARKRKEKPKSFQYSKNEKEPAKFLSLAKTTADL